MKQSTQEREREDDGREVEAGSVRRQVESKRRRGRETGRGGHEGHERMQERKERKERKKADEREMKGEGQTEVVQTDVCPDRGRERMRQQGDCGMYSCTSSVYE